MLNHVSKRGPGSPVAGMTVIYLTTPIGVRGMLFLKTLLNIFHLTLRYVMLCFTGLKVHFCDGHVDTIGNVDGLPRQSFHLRDGEKIVAAQVKASLLVDQLFFWTNTNQVHGPFIGTGGHRYQKEAPVRQDDDGYLGGLICQAVCHRDQWVLSNLTFKWLVSRHKRITGSCSISCDEDSDVIVCDDNDGSDWFGMHDDDLPWNHFFHITGPSVTGEMERFTDQT